MIFFHRYIKLPKNRSANYYQESKERLKKKLVKDIKVLLKKKKKMLQKSLRRRKKNLLRVENNVKEWERTLYYNYNKLVF